MNDQTSTVTLTQAAMGAAAATLALLTYLFGWSPDLSALILAMFAGWFGLASLAWPRFLVARGRVLEERDGDKVLAGDANNMVEPGEVVRPYVPERALNEDAQ
ncbi:hypothetical protein M3G03_09955 [Aestuariimicrobium sp. p3-SID1156]|uniref:hypothetical protein n=1 Tax=Aestuariimicrobium sp. p3-SID1156 TaxID=2916038 RepID=UPI00223C5320|nr:hypothetical protein [Aestuariimicrobium sp. p3-SID1156]MCT1459853.1 hypothetical protein [Aestuariimicrobium sp. p3-SID1156]